MNKSKGFTIIELIVVIAIIAVLAAIVLVNVTQYIAKGRDSAIKGDMSTVLANSAVFFDSQSPSTYVGFSKATAPAVPSSLYTNPIVSAAGSTTDLTQKGAGATGTCTVGSRTNYPCSAESASGFCATIILNDGNLWCVDSTGFSGAPAITGTPAISVCGTVAAGVTTYTCK